ncbi:hypothetical protein SCHPADRAFT_995645 [Schizopora paradoxa]|uniref:Uncharacterized protein n=1 Tax=Schizopora paradoxa TaxID=27342 RepID=A0A0H2RV98_9AGAM|nr:hypothetical protein SCHPADRAFT_995645 [Schizopora paradoxa]
MSLSVRMASRMDTRSQEDRDVISLRHEMTESKLQTSPPRGHISRLPEDILAQIFTYLLPKTLAMDDNLHFDLDWSLHKRRRHDHLIAITHVCRAWRMICLPTKTFWDLIWISDDDVSRSRAEKFIERSGGRPLEVAVHDEEVFFRTFGEGRAQGRRKVRHLTGPLFEPVLALHALFPQGASRIQTLQISSMHKQLHAVHIPTFFSMPAPVLESFLLADVAFHVPSTLFANHTPKLRKLAMCNVAVPWASSIFKNLTSIRFDCTLINSSLHGVNYRVDVHRLLEIVRDCPNLITLALDDVGPIGKMSDLTKTATPDSLKVSALHFAIIHVRFDQELAHFFTFLNGLYTPNLRHLYVAHPGPCVENIRRILPVTFTFDARLNTCNCLHLVIDVYHLSAVCKHFLVDDLDARLSNNRRKVSLRYLIKKASFKSRVRIDNNDDDDTYDEEDYEAEFRTYERFLPSFFHRLSPIPENIRALSLRIEPESNIHMSYRDIFQIFRNVHWVEVQGTRDEKSLEDFSVFLRQAAAIAKEDGNGSALASVQMIIFDKVKFKNGELADIRHFLVHRMQQKEHLLYLGLRACEGVDARLLPVLRELVKVLFISGGGYLDGVEDDEDDGNEDEVSSEDEINFF